MNLERASCSGLSYIPLDWCLQVGIVSREEGTGAQWSGMGSISELVAAAAASSYGHKAWFTDDQTIAAITGASAVDKLGAQGRPVHVHENW